MGLRLRAPLLTSFPWSVPQFLAGIYDLHTLPLAKNPSGKNSVRNIQYGTQTWLARGLNYSLYTFLHSPGIQLSLTTVYKNSSKAY